MASAASGPRHLFVYGTLRPGHAPAEIAAHMRRLDEVGRATVRGRVYDLGEYPAAVLDAAIGTRIEGTVLRLPEDPSVLAAIDAYEGRRFVRTRASARLSDGRRVACWMYVCNGDPGTGRLLRPQPARQSTK